MTTRADLRTELRTRLNELAAVIWTDVELNGYLTQGIKSLYPNFWVFKTATTTATNGPLQTNPANARNVYYLGLQKPGSTRVRMLRQWREGDVSTYVPKVGIAGQTLVWAWTQSFTAPSDDTTVLNIPIEAEEVVVLQGQITALERVMASRVSSAKYFALTVREGVTEADIVQAIDMLHASLEQRLANAIKLPTRQG